MAQTDKGSTGPGNKVPHQGDHDRVAMLSVKADGTPDQHNPEFIGDREGTLEATKEQFAQQAVSAVDVARNDPSADVVEDAPQDPSIEDARKEHEKAADAAKKAAESAVKALHPDA